MDLGAALSPVGALQMQTQAVNAARSAPLRATRLQLGSAFGDGLAQGLAGQEVAAFDALGAPFWQDAAALVRTAGRPSGTVRLQEFLSFDMDAPKDDARPPGMLGLHPGWRFGLHARPAPGRASLLNIAGPAATLAAGRSGWEIAAFTTAGREGRPQAQHGAVLSWRAREAGAGLRLGLLREPAGLLGARAHGAFGTVSGSSAALGLEWRGGLGAWRLSADAEWGLVDAQAVPGLLGAVSGVATSAASLRAWLALSGADDVTLSLSQPVRVERGEALLRLPVGRTADGGVAVNQMAAQLRPSGRQLDFAAHWRRRGVFGGELRTGLLYSRHPGHAAGVSEVGLLLGWRGAF